MNQKTLLGYLGLFGAISVGIGEFLLHYSDQVLTTEGAFMFFGHVPVSHLYYGHFFAMLGLPFYYAGYLHIYMMLRTGQKTLAVMVLGLGFMAFSVGGVWIGSRGFMGSIVHLHSDISFTTFDIIVGHYSALMENLVQFLRVFILLLSIAFATAILKGGTEYRKWMAFFNPISILLFFVAIGTISPWIGKFTLPILMNITHIVIFSLSLYQHKTNLKS
ncbi:MAG: DUF6796 family protein [Saprospiraceae bacterium]